MLRPSRSALWQALHLRNTRSPAAGSATASRAAIPSSRAGRPRSRRRSRPPSRRRRLRAEVPASGPVRRRTSQRDPVHRVVQIALGVPGDRERLHPSPAIRRAGPDLVVAMARKRNPCLPALPGMGVRRCTQFGGLPGRAEVRGDVDSPHLVVSRPRLAPDRDARRAGRQRCARLRVSDQGFHRHRFDDPEIVFRHFLAGRNRIRGHTIRTFPSSLNRHGPGPGSRYG